mmetsp:Transcript_9748/g.40164  ORF Transcript_9748/g.40164 Transcript_9748/m.40164 type:complete len:254 (-) Transcript_9748:259-1020(-)
MTTTARQSCAGERLAAAVAAMARTAAARHLTSPTCISTSAQALTVGTATTLPGSTPHTSASLRRSLRSNERRALERRSAPQQQGRRAMSASPRTSRPSAAARRRPRASARSTARGRASRPRARSPGRTNTIPTTHRADSCVAVWRKTTAASASAPSAATQTLCASSSTSSRSETSAWPSWLRRLRNVRPSVRPLVQRIAPRRTPSAARVSRLRVLLRLRRLPLRALRGGGPSQTAATPNHLTTTTLRRRCTSA